MSLFPKQRVPAQLAKGRFPASLRPWISAVYKVPPVGQDAQLGIGTCPEEYSVFILRYFDEEALDFGGKSRELAMVAGHVYYVYLAVFFGAKARMTV